MILMSTWESFDNIPPIQLGSTATSSSITPVDGAEDLWEEEMAQSVFGQQSCL